MSSLWQIRKYESYSRVNQRNFVILPGFSLKTTLYGPSENWITDEKIWKSSVSLSSGTSLFYLFVGYYFLHTGATFLAWWSGMSQQCCWTVLSWAEWRRLCPPRTPPLLKYRPVLPSETTHVRRPELQTVRELNSREFIPWFKMGMKFNILPRWPKCNEKFCF